MADIIIRRDEQDELVLNVDGVVGWQISEELKAGLTKELKAHLGGEFSNEFDPAIIEALHMLEED